MAAKYGTASKKSVKRALHKMKAGTLKSGKSKKTVKSRKQAIAIGLSEARKKGAKVPRKKQIDISAARELSRGPNADF